MGRAATVRLQVESALSRRIPSALTPQPRQFRETLATGIQQVDDVLEGGLPVGAITEIVGPECSGRTSLALSFLARVTQAGKVCAWVDVSDTLQPESAASSGVDLARLLWIRCRARAVASQGSTNDFKVPEKYFVPALPKKGLHGGSFGPHPRAEARGLSEAVGELLAPKTSIPCGESLPLTHNGSGAVQATAPRRKSSTPTAEKPWHRLDQALRVTDLLLQGGGFSAIVLDMGSIAPDFALRVPLATWFRYRAAAERTRASILLLTQHTCAKSSAGLVLNLEAEEDPQESIVFTGLRHRVAVQRHRFQPSNVVSLRKPPKSERGEWQTRTTWAGLR